MRTIILSIILAFCSFSIEAKKAVSLNDAVKKAESSGRVLSARTVNNKHEVKVLTPSGEVKTKNYNAGDNRYRVVKERPQYYNNGGKSMRDRRDNISTPSHFSNYGKSRSSIKLNRSNRGQVRNVQPTVRERSSVTTKSNKKDQ